MLLLLLLVAALSGRAAMLWSSFAKGRGISPASISPATRRDFVFVVHCLQNDTCKIHVLIEERLSMLRQKEVEFFRCLFWCSPLFPRSNFNQRTPKRGTSDIIRMQQQSYEIMWVINKREEHDIVVLHRCSYFEVQSANQQTRALIFSQIVRIMSTKMVSN